MYDTLILLMRRKMCFNIAASARLWFLPTPMAKGCEVCVCQWDKEHLKFSISKQKTRDRETINEPKETFLTSSIKISASETNTHYLHKKRKLKTSKLYETAAKAAILDSRGVTNDLFRQKRRKCETIIHSYYTTGWWLSRTYYSKWNRTFRRIRFILSSK